MAEKIIKADLAELATTIDFIKSQMSSRGCKSKEINQALLICEECIVAIVDNANSASEIKISVKNHFGKVALDIISIGNALDLDSSILKSGLDLYDEDDANVAYAIRNLLMRHYSDRIKYSRKGNTNFVRILLTKDEKFQMKLSIGAMICAIILGVVFRICTPEVGRVINDNLFSPIANIFVKSMRCLVGPIVFLSVLNSIIGFDDMRLLGRVGAKVMLIYTVTSIIATLVGLGAFYLFNPGEFGSYIPQNVSAIEANNSTSLVAMIVAFFPDNLVAAFLNNDTIQLIIIAVAFGIALNTMGERNERVKELIGALNESVNRICSYVSNIIPIVIICAISGLILTSELDTLVSLLYMALIVLIGYAVMVVLYSISVWIFAKVNPFVYLKKYMPTALTVFSLASSNATIPINMEFSKKIGVSKKVYSFAIPLGATINMDGGCVFFPIAVLFLSKLYGVTFDVNMIIQLVFLVIMISMGTPGVAGGVAALMIPMLAIGGVPAEMALMIVGIDTIIDMFRTALNTLGDQSATLIAASSEGLLDRDMYYEK